MVDKKVVVIVGVAVAFVVLLSIGLALGLGVEWNNSDSDSPGESLPPQEEFSGAKLVHNESPTKIQDQWLAFMSDDASLDEVEEDLNSANMPWTVNAKYNSLKVLSMGCPESVLGQAMNMPTMKKYALYVEPDQTYNVTQGEIWGLDRIDQRNLPLNRQFFRPTQTGAGVHVYVLDTGIRTTHNEFGGRVSNGFTAINDGQGTNDCNGHGTHVAGTIGGTTYGVAKSAILHPVRVLGCTGSGSNAGVIAGVDWVTSNRLQPAIASMSLGGGASTALDNALRRSINAGVTYVVAAGNENRDACAGSPARVPEAITVGATTSTDQRASYSNFGTCVDIFAPGSGILSAWYTSNSATNTISGTSMATPHVSGVIALYLQNRSPVPTPAQTAAALIAGSTSNVISDVKNSPNKFLFWPFGTTQQTSAQQTSAQQTSAQQTSAQPTQPNPTTGTPSTCSGVCKQNTGSLQARGSLAYHPDGTWYRSTTAGVHRAALSGPSNADFDLVLYKWTGSNWARVAASEGATSSEVITYNGAAGYYTWRVNSYLGSGSYSISMEYPR